MQIIPGYDFAQNEIPTPDKFHLAATGMSLFELTLSQLATALIGIQVTDGSQTSLPAVGWLAVDYYGNLWGRGRGGMVRVWRSRGGWESNRYQFIHSGQSADAVCRPGELIQIGELVANDTNESNTVYKYVQNGDRTLTAMTVGVPDESVASGTHGRFVMRGQVAMFGPAFVPNNASRRQQAYRDTVFTPHWVFDTWGAGLFGNGIQGEVCMHFTDNLDDDDYVFGHFYGPCLKAN